MLWLVVCTILSMNVAVHAQCSSVLTCDACFSRAECCWIWGECRNVDSECPSWLNRKCTTTFPATVTVGPGGSANLDLPLPTYVSVSPSLNTPLSTTISCSDKAAQCTITCKPRSPTLLKDTTISSPGPGGGGVAGGGGGGGSGKDEEIVGVAILDKIALVAFKNIGKCALQRF
jgi:hypothetical protein